LQRRIKLLNYPVRGHVRLLLAFDISLSLSPTVRPSRCITSKQVIINLILINALERKKEKWTLEFQQCAQEKSKETALKLARASFLVSPRNPRTTLHADETREDKTARKKKEPPRHPDLRSTDDACRERPLPARTCLPVRPPSHHRPPTRARE
jgi:hypothetical protein